MRDHYLKDELIGMKTWNKKMIYKIGIVEVREWNKSDKLPQDAAEGCESIVQRNKFPGKSKHASLENLEAAAQHYHYLMPPTLMLQQK